MASRYTAFLGTTPGLEDVLEAEVKRLGVAAEHRLEGGIEVVVELPELWRLALQLRTAESLRVRLGEVAAPNFEALAEGLARLPWNAYLPRGSTPVIRVSSRGSALYHQRAVAERAAQAIARRLARPDGVVVPPSPATVFVRIVRDRAQVSIDGAGELLHRRGYRTHVGRAPLRETLAAACLLLAGCAPGRRWWDPFCGSGTLVIEAAGILLGRPAWAGRRFAFESWPIHDAEAFARLLGACPPLAPVAPTVFGSDLDPPEVEAARANAERAGLGGACAFFEGDFEVAAARVPPDTAIVTNLPYGRRSGGGEGGLLRTFSRFGELLRSGPGRRPVFVLAGHRGFQAATRMGWDVVRAFSNRGVPVALLRLKEGPARGASTQGRGASSERLGAGKTR